MEIVIFKELTTNDYLVELQVEAEKYTGLYVDMDNAPERKYVKDKANDIKQLLKKIDRKRIDASKEFKLSVEKEAADIIEKLKTANEPFTLLIDAYAAERAKILSEEKRTNDELVAALQLEDDHEDAISLNRLFDLESGERARLKVEHEKQLIIEREEYAKEQVEKAAANQILINEAIERDKVHAENARLANKEHCSKVNNAILDVLMDSGIGIDNAKDMIRLAAQNKLPQLTINY